MFTFRNLYFLWLIIHLAALFFSGWFSRVTIYKGASWKELIGYSSNFWPVQSFNLASYDITEFLIYYAFIPYLVYRFFDTYMIFQKHR
jgi:hypothetical protein